MNNSGLQQVNKMIANLIINSLIFTNYIGYKFNQAFNELDSRQQADLKEWAKNETDFFFKNEVKFTQENYSQSQQNAVIDFISYQVSSLYQLLNWQSSLSQPSTNPVIQQFSQLVAKVNQAPQVAAVVDPDASEAMQDSDYDF